MFYASKENEKLIKSKRYKMRILNEIESQNFVRIPLKQAKRVDFRKKK